jgi:hypothetical protein
VNYEPLLDDAQEGERMPTPRRRRKDPEVAAIANDASRRPVESVTRAPSHDAIARRAYELYRQRGSEHGRDWDDWLQAERELRERAESELFGQVVKDEGPYLVI